MNDDSGLDPVEIWKEFITDVALVGASSVNPMAALSAGALGALLSERKDARFRKNIQILVNELKQAAATLDKSKVDQEYVQSLEFADLLEKIWEKLKHESDVEKIKHLAKAMATFSYAGAYHGDREIYLDVLLSISVIDLEILGILEEHARKSGTAREKRQYAMRVDEIKATMRSDGITSPSITVHCHRLHQWGLTEKTVPYGGFDIGSGAWAVKGAGITLIKLLQGIHNWSAKTT